MNLHNFVGLVKQCGKDAGRPGPCGFSGVKGCNRIVKGNFRAVCGFQRRENQRFLYFCTKLFDMKFADLKNGNDFRKMFGLLPSIAAALLISAAHPLLAQQVPTPKTSVSAGFGVLIYQSGFGVENTIGFEAAVGRSIREQLTAEAGFRLGLDPILPDIFLRLIVTQQFGIWKPSVGIENGYSNRAFFEGDSDLLKETRDAMTNEMGHWYISSHVEPLCFGLKHHWDISIATIDIGTHYKNIGSTMRLNVNLLKVRKSF
jgi:hypothetical protein